MSIVEKALAKAQSVQGRPVELVSTGSSEARAAIGRRDQAAIAPPVVAAPRTGGSITLDRGVMVREGLIPPREFAHRIMDEYRRIKWPVLDIAFGRSRTPAPYGNIIVVTSAVPGEGKTFSATNLAMALAMERDCTVLLVDADLARPRISTVLGLLDRPGLVDALIEDDADWRNYALATDIPGLSVLPAGRRSGQGPELLASRRMETILNECARTDGGEIIIIDSAPLLATNEAQVLARLAGQLLLVVRANSTPQPAVGEALSLLDRSKPIGLILNQARTVFGDYYYGHYDEYNKNRE